MAIVSPVAAGPAAGAAARRRIETAPDGNRRDGRIGEIAVPVLERDLRRLDDDVHVVGLLERRDVESFEQRQDRERRESLGRRREAGGLAASVPHAQGLDPLGLMPGQVVAAQRAAGGARGLHEPASERAAVERVASALRDLLESRRKIGLHEPLALQALGMEDPPELPAEVARRRVSEQVRGVSGLPTLARRRREPVAGMGDGGLEQGAPRDRRAQRLTAQRVSRPPARDDARHRQGRRAAANRNRRPEARAICLEIGRGSRAARGVQRAQTVMAAVVDQPEAVAAHAVHVRVDDRDRGARGDRGVDGVSAALQHGQTGLRGKGVRGRHEPACAARLRPSGGDGHARDGSRGQR
jgi:hypothetical protein